MRIYPPATYRPLPEAELQTPIVPVLIILHTIVGSAKGAEQVMRGDHPGESHFVLPFTGAGVQLVPLDRRADCNWKVNSWVTGRELRLSDGRVVPAGTVCGAISIETEDDGTPEDTPWTAAQVEWMAQFIAWAHRVWGVPLAPPATPFDPGVGYHSLPGKNTLAIWDKPGAVPPYGTMLDAKGRTVHVYNPWTNTVGKSCPGAARIAQFPAVLARASEITDPTPPAPPVLPTPSAPPTPQGDIVNVLFEIIDPTTGTKAAEAEFYSAVDGFGNALWCEWTGPGDPATPSGRRRLAHLAAGIERRQIGLGSLQNMRRLGPLPTGDRLRAWADSDFGAV